MGKNVCKSLFDCHVVRACEIKYTPSGVAIGNFSIAVNDSFKKNGEWVDEASFFECVAYGKTAETLKNYVTSGQRMFFEMRPKQERWVDKEGKKRSRVVFIVEDFSFGEKPRGAQQPQGQNVPQPQYQQQQQNYNAQQFQQPPAQQFQPQTPPPQYEQQFQQGAPGDYSGNPPNGYQIF